MPNEFQTPLYAAGAKLQIAEITATLPTGVNKATPFTFDEKNKLPPQTQGYATKIRAVGGNVYYSRYAGDANTVQANSDWVIFQDCTVIVIWAKGTGANAPLFHLSGDGTSHAVVNVEEVRQPWMEAQRGELGNQ